MTSPHLHPPHTSIRNVGCTDPCCPHPRRLLNREVGSAGAGRSRRDQRGGERRGDQRCVGSGSDHERARSAARQRPLTCGAAHFNPADRRLRTSSDGLRAERASSRPASRSPWTASMRACRWPASAAVSIDRSWAVARCRCSSAFPVARARSTAAESSLIQARRLLPRLRV